MPCCQRAEACLIIMPRPSHASSGRVPTQGTLFGQCWHSSRKGAPAIPLPDIEKGTQAPIFAQKRLHSALVKEFCFIRSSEENKKCAIHDMKDVLVFNRETLEFKSPFSRDAVWL
uniref:Uncharacterized protein n=1 Tax=Sphaerodactylus townsendi TaxID=933632 RepID=A0ACB8ECG1_9SAUR